MANAILMAMVGFFNALSNTIFAPIFRLLDELLSTLDLDPYIDLFSTFLTDFVAPFLAYFIELIPTRSLGVIILELTVTLLFFNLSALTHLGLKALELIKKLPLA